MPPLEHLLLCWPISWSGSRVRVHGGVLPRNHEADIASGAVLSLRRRRLDIHVTAPCRRRDDPSMFSLGLSPHALRARRAPDACAGGTPGAEWRVPFLDSPKELDHETGTVPLSRVRGVVPSTWRAGALAWAAAKVHAPSESRMSQGVGRCHVEGPSRRETSLYIYINYNINAPRRRLRRDGVASRLAAATCVRTTVLPIAIRVRSGPVPVQVVL